MKSERLGGWQFWVDIYDDYVIKTPKNREEVEEEVKKFLIWKNKIEELEERTNKMISDVKYSEKIIKRTKVPRKFLADLEFIKEGKIKQKKVVLLENEFNRLSKNEQEGLVKKICKLILELWEYGIHEKTFKILSNFGVNGNYGLSSGQVVLIDPFEITSDKEKVLNQIINKKWHKPEVFRKHLSEEMTNYLIMELDKTFTEENLNKYWKKKLEAR